MRVNLRSLYLQAAIYAHHIGGPGSRARTWLYLMRWAGMPV